MLVSLGGGNVVDPRRKTLLVANRINPPATGNKFDEFKDPREREGRNGK